MKNKKTGLLSVLFAAVLLIAGISGSAVAYMRTRTVAIENDVEPAYVSCEVIETLTEDKTAKTDIQVKNTGNIDAYLRIRLVTYWVNNINDKEQPVAETSASLTEIPFDNENWIAGSGNTYYYKKPVAPEAMVEFLKIGDSIVLQASVNGNWQVIEVFAEAIQSLPANAVYESWGVTLSGDEIMEVPE